MAAEFYGTLAEFRTYFTDRHVDTTSYIDADVTSALVVASEWLDANFRMSFGGLKINMRAQVREWPRAGALDIYGYAIDQTTIPREMNEATYQAALRQLQLPGQLSIDFTPGKYTSVRVEGAIAVGYASYNFASEAATQFPIIGEILRPILTAGGANGSYHSGAIIRS